MSTERTDEVVSFASKSTEKIIRVVMKDIHSTLALAYT